MFRSVFILLISLLALGWQAGGAATAAAVEPETDAAAAAIDYIKSQQNPDGGFIGFGEESSPGVTLDAVFALIAAGEDVKDVTNGGNSAIDYLETQAAEYATDPGAAAKLALALWLVQAGGSEMNLSDFGGVNLFGATNTDVNDETGQVGLDTFDHVFFVMGGVAFLGGRAPTAPGLVDYFRTSQLDDGGWEFGEGFGSDSNTTAMVLQTLIGVGITADDPAVVAGLAYLRSLQDASGAFAFLADTDPDAQSTAMVIQALAAAGEDIDAGGPWAPGGVGPLDVLLTFQNAETGAFQFAGEDSPFATYQVVPGLLLLSFPGLGTLPAPEPYVPADDGPTAPPHGDNTGPVVAPPPADLPKVGTGASSNGSPWMVAALAAGGLAALGVAGLGLVLARRRAA